jgi:hypothetical protein
MSDLGALLVVVCGVVALKVAIDCLIDWLRT